MNLIAGRPPPTYKTRPDPEFWRNFTWFTQPSADDGACPRPSLFSSQGLRNRRHTALGNISRRLPCERKEVKEHETYQSPTAEAGGTDRTRRLRLWKRRQPQERQERQEPWLQEPRLQVSRPRWCNQTQGTHQASVALWTPGGSRTNRGWRKRPRRPLLRILRFLRRNS